jgi:hypothetical protein
MRKELYKIRLWCQKMAVENKAKIWAVMGQSGTGKGLWTKAQLRKLKPKRIIILDPQDEYMEFASPVASAGALSRLVCAGAVNGSFKVRYVFPKSATEEHFRQIFDLACQLAYMAKNCIFLVEELSNFTKPSYAPPLWRRMCNSGRHEGVHVIGCSQFPAQVDKSFLSNATLIHVGFLGQEPHRKAIAQVMDIQQEKIRDLPDLEFIEWKREGRTLEIGSITTTGRIKQTAFSA